MSALVILDAINQAILARFDKADREKPQDYIITGVDVGVPGLSGDGDCATLASGLADALAVDNFPQPAATGCGNRLAYSLRIGIYRCVPVGDDLTGGESDKTELEASAAEILLDIEMIYCGIRDALKQNGFDHRIGVYTPVGPQGGIGGGHWTVLVDSLRDD